MQKTQTVDIVGSLSVGMKLCTPKGIRTPVAGLKGPCPGPLDDGGGQWTTAKSIAGVGRAVKFGQTHSAITFLADVSGIQLSPSFLSHHPLEILFNAESFATFVLKPKPTGDTLADEKVAFFYDYSELVKLRAEMSGRL